MIKKLLAGLVLGLTALVGAAQTHVFPATDTNNTFTGNNTFNGKVTVNGGIFGYSIFQHGAPTQTCSPTSVYAGLTVVDLDNSNATYICDSSGSTWRQVGSSGSGMVYPAANKLGKSNNTANGWTAPTYQDITALFGGGSCAGVLNFDGSCPTIAPVNGVIVTANTTASCGQFIRDDAVGAITITLPGIQAGCSVAIERGPSAGTLTITPPAGPTYDGPTTQIPQGGTTYAWTDGTNWHATPPFLAGANCTITSAATGNTFNCTTPSSGVTQIIAGANVAVSPIGGTGVVTISFTGSANIALPLTTQSVGSGMIHLTDSGGPGGVIVISGAPSNGTGTNQCPGASNANLGQVYLDYSTSPYTYYNCDGATSKWVAGLPIGSTTERIFAVYNQQSTQPSVSGDYPYPGTRYSNSSGLINTGNAACMDVFNIELYPWETPNNAASPTYFNQCGLGDWFNWAHSIGWGSITDATVTLPGTLYAGIAFEGSPKNGLIPAQSTTGVGTTGTWTNVDPTTNTTTGTASSGSTALTVTTAGSIAKFWRVADTTNPASIAPGTYVSAITGTSVTLSQNTVASISGDTLVFTNNSVAPFRAGYGKSATGSGSLTFTFNASPNSAVYLLYLVDGTPGTATATCLADGVSCGTIGSGDGGTFSTVHSTQAWWGKRLALSTNSSHTVTLTVTSGTMTILGLSIPKPGQFGGLSMPLVVQEAMPPAGGGYNALDNLLYQAELNVVSQMKSDGYNVQAADFWKGWPESTGATQYYEHNAGSYGNGLTAYYSNSPHFNDLGNKLNADTMLQAARKIPYSAPALQLGSSNGLVLTKSQSDAYLDVNTVFGTPVAVVTGPNTFGKGPQRVLTGASGTVGRSVQATGTVTTPVTTVQNGNFNYGTTTPAATFTAGNAVAIIEAAGAPITPSSTGSETVTGPITLATSARSNYNFYLYIFKTMVGGSETLSLASGAGGGAKWFELSHLNTTNPVETSTFVTVSGASNVYLDTPFTLALTLTEPNDFVVGFGNSTRCSNIGASGSVAPWYIPSVLNVTNLTPNVNSYDLNIWGASPTTTVGVNSFTIDPNPNCAGNYGAGTDFVAGLVAFRSALSSNQTANLDEWYDENGTLTSYIDRAGVPHGPLAAGSFSANGSPVSNPNLNSSSPSPDTNNYASTVKVSGSNIIVETPAAGASSAGLVKCGSGTTCAADGTLSVAGGSGTAVNNNGGASLGTSQQDGMLPYKCVNSTASTSSQSCTSTTSFTPTTSNCWTYQTNTTNGTALTVSVNSLSKSVALPNGVGTYSTTLTASQLPINTPLRMCYDGTNYNVDLSGSSGASGGGLYSAILTSIPTLAGTGLNANAIGCSRGTYSATNASTGIVFVDTSATGTSNICYEGQAIAYPGTAFTLTALFSSPHVIGQNQFPGAGLVAMDTVPGGKQLVLRVVDNSGPTEVHATTNNSPSSNSGDTNYGAIGYNGGPNAIWLRWKDNGTVVTHYYSTDGIFWQQMGTVTKTGSFLGTSGYNFLGFVVDPQVSSTSGIGSTLMYWNITTP